MADKIQMKTDPELREFLPKYVENRKRDLHCLCKAFEERDFKIIQTISHKIRGHALSYGFPPLSQICTLMERAATDENLEVIASTLNEYRDYLEQIELY